ncbi:MAG: transposase family protein, partial [Anaerolineae bacterium]
MGGQIHPQSILGRIIALVPDPRSRRGRIYPLAAILGMLLLGALEGEGSLRGMWMRGKKHWQALIAALGVVGVPRPPELSTVWYVLQRIDQDRSGAGRTP